MYSVDGVEMLSVEEAARLARRTPETIRRWVWSGRLPARRAGRRLLVDRREVEQLVGAATSSSSERLSLEQWQQRVLEERRQGRLGEPSGDVSAADLVTADRRQRSR